MLLETVQYSSKSRESYAESRNPKLTYNNNMGNKRMIENKIKQISCRKGISLHIGTDRKMGSEVIGAHENFPKWWKHNEHNSHLITQLTLATSNFRSYSSFNSNINQQWGDSIQLKIIVINRWSTRYHKTIFFSF